MCVCVCMCVSVCVYIYIYFFTNNLIMPKIYHSRDAREMFPSNSNCFIFILFNNSEYLTMTPMCFLPEKNQKKRILRRMLWAFKG